MSKTVAVVSSVQQIRISLGLSIRGRSRLSLSRSLAVVAVVTVEATIVPKTVHSIQDHIRVHSIRTTGQPQPWHQQWGQELAQPQQISFHSSILHRGSHSSHNVQDRGHSIPHTADRDQPWDRQLP